MAPVRRRGRSVARRWVARRWVARRSGDGGEAGMVTAETAVVLPVLLLVLAGAVAAVTTVGAQLRCVDAAREGARAAARGEAATTVARIVGELSPDGAVTRMTGGVDEVRVTVTVRVAPLGLLPFEVTLSGEAVAVREPGGAEDPG